jgi:hypothetical protein
MGDREELRRLFPPEAILQAFAGRPAWTHRARHVSQHIFASECDCRGNVLVAVSSVEHGN